MLKKKMIIIMIILGLIGLGGRILLHKYLKNTERKTNKSAAITIKLQTL